MPVAIAITIITPGVVPPPAGRFRDSVNDVDYFVYGKGRQGVGADACYARHATM